MLYYRRNTPRHFLWLGHGWWTADSFGHAVAERRHWGLAPVKAFKIDIDLTWVRHGTAYFHFVRETWPRTDFIFKLIAHHIISHRDGLWVKFPLHYPTQSMLESRLIATDDGPSEASLFNCNSDLANFVQTFLTFENIPFQSDDVSHGSCATYIETKVELQVR